MTKLVGGQAVIEGVMMRNEDNIAIAVRDPKKEIQIKRLKLHIPKIKIPIVRGIINLVYMMYIGIKSLNYSSSIALEEESKKQNPFLSIIILIIGLGLAIILFKFLPLGAAEIVDRNFEINNYFYNIIDGIVKIIIFIGYILLISRIKDVQRVFQYHGAEHMAVNAFEHNDLENVKNYSIVHRRCGTTFIFLVLFIAIIVYMFIPKYYSFGLKLGLRLLLLPLIAGISYEILKLAGKYENWFFNMLIVPGLLIQKLTTKEPTDDQIEVAVKALKVVI
ncbi:DUF1385 domain-containing protein [Candidatus Woesearchaeota archaeon]|nr:DUF1385 domain-containing protein [Candidatus Woesearchaeota archaeon]